MRSRGGTGGDLDFHRQHWIQFSVPMLGRCDQRRVVLRLMGAAELDHAAEGLREIAAFAHATGLRCAIELLNRFEVI